MAASYPTAVKSFTSKSAGDTIQPAHVNDLQDEVAAIEGGLLGGTAPLNSSRSTLASLSVTGNSTLAALNAGASTLGSLSVTGASTLASLQVANSTVGNLVVSGGLSVGASTFTSIQAGNSTVGNLTASNVAVSSNCTVVGGLTVTGGSTLGTVQAGDSTLANLTVSSAATVGTLSAGNSTAANLSVSSNCTVTGGLTVTGGSTLGTVSGGNSTFSNLQISSNCTITGNLVVTGTITGVTAPTVASYVQAKLVAAQTLSDTALTLVNLEEVEDLAGEFDSTNHIFTPKSSGYYSIAARVYAGAVSTGTMTVGIYVNSSAVAVNRDATAGAISGRTYAIHTLQRLSSGTAGNVSVWAQANQTTGVTLSTGVAWTALDILRVF
jgi:hypothetical protein